MKTAAVLAALRTTGFAVLSPLDGIEETNAFLLSRPVYVDAHVPQTARNRPRLSDDTTRFERRLAENSECVCVHTDDAILAPNIFERALAMTDVAAAYLDCEPPVAYSANAFWTRPGPAPLRDDIQAFHVDRDDVRFLAMFVYLTDVLAAEDGPQDLEGPDGVVRTIFGPAGTVFLADTSRSHRGRKPLQAERGLAWWRWGVSERPEANRWDKIEPVAAARLAGRYPEDLRLRESIRLLVTGGKP